MSSQNASTSPAAVSSEETVDLVVIGGGSGGLAAAKEAAKLNPSKSVLCLDFVTPSHQGTKWGLGGTCVNVGCIPKKLMHHAATIGSMMHVHAEQFGWDLPAKLEHNWERMQTLITDYIRSLNFSYRVGLRSAGVKYAEGLATFESDKSLVYRTNAGKAVRVHFDKAVIATGGRPFVPQIPGWQHAITSDDIFWKKDAPGKTLVIGAGYIALECASFLQHLNFDVSVMIRGRILRKMDHQSGEMIGELMERDGVRFLVPTAPAFLRSTAPAPDLSKAQEVRKGVFSMEADAKGNKRFYHAETGVVEIHHNKPAGLVTYSRLNSANGKPAPIEVTYLLDGQEVKETFDTVLFATGRSANIANLNLAAAKVRIEQGKVLVDNAEKTTNPNIFAIGDVAIGVERHVAEEQKVGFALDRPELTPVAIQAGQYLARRLWSEGNGESKTAPLMNYLNIATAVFTSPSEYGFVGMSEEHARMPKAEGGIGSDNVNVYWSRFGNLEISPLHPQLIEPRSKAFLGKNLWARNYANRHNLDWNEVSYDPEGMTCNVLYTASGSSQAQPALVTEKHVTPMGQITYTVKLESSNQELKDVSPANLALSEEQEKESGEVFYKANCLAKLICDKSRNDLVVGLHFMGPNAGEVVQGFAMALMMGATKEQFDAMVGIHPTAAEEFSVLTVSQYEGASPLKPAGCGGGSCG